MNGAAGSPTIYPVPTPSELCSGPPPMRSASGMQAVAGFFKLKFEAFAEGPRGGCCIAGAPAPWRRAARAAGQAGINSRP
jgi:hypothetical protein